MNNPALVQRDMAKSVGAYLTKNIDKLRGTLVNTGLSPERMARVAVNAISKSPELQKCSLISLVGSVLQSAALGLEPNTVLGEAALIPYKGSCTFQPMYKGLIKLARRGGVTEVYAESIREGDEVEVLRGTENRLTHKIKLDKRGKTLAYYAVFKTPDGGCEYEIMTVDDIEAIRKRSAGVQAGRSTPWQTDYDEMAKKTVLKRLLKRAPLTVEAAEAVEADHKAESPDLADFEILSDLGLERPIEDKVESAGSPSDLVKRGAVILGTLDRGEAAAFLHHLGWIKEVDELDTIEPERLADIAKDEEAFRKQVQKFAELAAKKTAVA